MEKVLDYHTNGKELLFELCELRNNLLILHQTQVQFIAVMMHTFQLCFWNECNYPMAFVYFIGGHAGLFLVLFANFYSKAYKPKPVSSYFRLKSIKTNLVSSTHRKRTRMAKQYKMATKNPSQTEKLSQMATDTLTAPTPTAKVTSTSRSIH